MSIGKYIMTFKKELNCHVCNKQLSTKLTLENHIQYVHEQKLQYNCELCHESMTSQSKLQTHQSAVHEGKSYSCDVCEKTFIQIRYLERHVTRVHNEISSKFSCEFCNRPPYSTLKNLENHINAIHNKIGYKCETCDKSFANCEQQRPKIPSGTTSYSK